jgi:hypothetical protein
MPLSNESREVLAKAATVAGATLLGGPIAGAAAAVFLKVCDAEAKAADAKSVNADKK